MAYHITVIEPNGDIAKFEYTNEPPGISMLHDWVDGFFETVPFWDMHDGKRAWVICNEEGKLEGLPINDIANAMWYDAISPDRTDDFLCGNVVIIACDTDEDFGKL